MESVRLYILENLPEPTRRLFLNNLDAMLNDANSGKLKPYGDNTSLPWWQTATLPFTALPTISPLEIYNAANGVLRQKKVVNVATYKLEVIDRTVNGWLKVFSVPEMWVKAEFTRPFVVG